MIQKLPLSGAPGPLEQTDPPVKEVLFAREFDAFAVSETTRGLVAQKRGFSEDEARLQEEALRNAVNEIEALSKTAVQAANQRTEKERHTPSENPQRAEGACEHAKEEAHRDGEDFIQSVRVLLSL